MSLRRRIAIDLGTANTLVWVAGIGIVTNEPTVVAISSEDNKVVAVGEDVKRMLGRTPESLIASRPMREGVIADYQVTKALLKYFISKVGGKMQIFKPDVMVCVPAGCTQVERRAALDATLEAGAAHTYLIDEPLAAAIGADIPIGSASGHMICDMGGGTSEIAVISLGGMVANTSVRIGGNKFDAAIQEFLKRKYNMAIGERTAEDLKIKIGSAQFMPKSERLEMEAKGRDLVSGLPRTIIVSSDDITEALQNELQGIINAVKSVLHKTPPELSADVMDKGMVLSGGTAMLRNMDKLLAKATGVAAFTADEANLCVARGTGIALENLESYKRSILSAK